MLMLLTLANLNVAEASSQLEFKTNGPVVVSVDGRKAAYTGRLRQRMTGLEPGLHEVRIATLLGKTLHESEIELADDTLTTAEWSAGALHVLSTESLGQGETPTDEDDEATAGAVEPEPEILDAPPQETALDAPTSPEPPIADIEDLAAEEVVEEPPTALEPVVEEVAAADIDRPHPSETQSAGLNLDIFAVPEEEPIQELPLAIPIAEPAAPAPSPKPSRAVSVHAMEGQTIAVIHEGQAVHIRVEQGAFIIDVVQD